MPERGESKRIPDWAARERAGDLAWIAENVHLFWPMAQAGFQEFGRGAIVAATAVPAVEHKGGKGHPFGYEPLEYFEMRKFEDAVRLVRQYDPSWEFVCVLLKQGRESAYRIGVPSERKNR